ncbi:MAG: glycosyltransferase [Solibacillus sp.]
MAMVVINLAYILGVIWLIWNVRQLPKLEGDSAQQPFISILIPLRNEEARVEVLICSLKQLDYPSLEVLLYNDDSADNTLGKLR